MLVLRILMSEKFPAFAAYRKSRWYKRSLWVGAIFLAYVLLGFIVVPPVLKAQLLKRLPPITKRQVAIRQVRFNPLVLSLTIRGLSLTEPDGAVFASWEELYVNFQLSSVFRLGWTFDEVKLEKPYGHLIWFKDGKFNFSNIGDDSPAPPKPEKPARSDGLPTINIARLHIDDGAVVWDDRTHSLPLKVELKPINFSLTNLTTRVGQGSRYGFEASSDSGKRVAWAGELVTRPFHSRGHLELVGIEGARWTAYVRDYLRAVVTDGRVNVAADYAIGTSTNGFSVVVSNGLVELTRFEVKEPTNNEVISTLPLLRVQDLDFDLLGQSLHAGLIKLDGYTKSMRIEKDGTLNLNMVVEQKTVVSTATNIAAAAVPPPTKPSPPWVFAVDDLQITNANITFSDLSRTSRFETTLSPMNVRVQHFTTKPEADASFEFNIPSEAGEVVSGTGTMCVSPFRLGGAVGVVGAEIKKYSPYYGEFLRGEVLGGKLNVGVDYRLRSSAAATELTLSNVDVALKSFQLKAADGGEIVVAIPYFEVSQTEFDLRKRMVTVGAVRSSDASILARRKQDGSINLVGLVNSPAPTTGGVETPAVTNSLPATQAPGREAAPWMVLVKEVAFDKYAIRWEDQKTAKPATLSLDGLRFVIRNISTGSNEPIALSLEARLNNAGTLSVNGSGKISPLSADFDIRVSELDLRSFQPYVNEGVRLGINSGQFDTQSHVSYGEAGEGGPRLKFTGDLSLTNLVTTDQVFFKEFVKWDMLSIKDIDFELDPNRLRLGEIGWRGFKTSVVIGPDHRSNLQIIMPEKATNAAVASAAPATETPAAAAAAPATPGEFPIQIGSLTLENTAFHFGDDSIEPHCEFDIEDFGGSIKGLSSEPSATATVDVRGKVGAGAPFSISGTVNPLARDLSLDLLVAFTNTDLTAFSTYVEKYGGYPLNKGKLSMGLKYDIHQKQLKAENKFVLDHFTLGGRNQSTNATHLPVKLAVALLKDSAGRIDLDLPISGRTDDPQFRVAPILLKAILNLMLKAATSPFSLLGSVVGGGGEELSFVAFAPGQSEMSEAEIQKLEKLAKALTERPALSLEIAGSFDPEKDRAALAKLKLEQEMKTMRLKELAEAGKSLPDISTLELGPSLRERLLKTVLAEMGTNETLVLQPVNAGNTNSAAEEPGLSAGANAMPQTPKIPGPHRPVKPSASEIRGATLLSPAIDFTAPNAAKRVAIPQMVVSTNGAIATPQDMEAKLVQVIKVSDDEKLDLMKRRAIAVQAQLLKAGKISAERLFIVKPRSGSPAGKGESRANLSLE